MALPTSGPTWYDVLGVERDASHDEVRAAWRAATDRVEPGTGQFRSYNEAAETLLDPTRRAAYDASLAPAVEPAAVRGPQEAAQESERETDPETDQESSTDVDRAVATPAKPRRSRERSTREPGRLVGRLGRVSVPVLVVLLVLVLAAATASVLLGRQVVQEARVADAREQAPVAAEQAAEAMLSYDYRELPSDQARAEGFLTGGFRTEFAKNFELLAEQEDGTPGPAVQTKAVVTAQSVGSGVVDVDRDGRTARVLVFVNQTSEKEGQDPQVFLNRVSMTMTERDGRWLVSDLRSY